jgi:hypothetical protein
MTEKLCFVIAPIGDPETDIRKRSDQILKHLIKPAVKERGYEAQRADEISDPGIITTQIIQHLIDASLVVADLTSRNPNVFYELAIRHAFGKPVIQLIRKGENVPFDVAAMRTIQVDHQDLDSVEEAKAEIIRQIDAIERGAKSENPVSVTLNLQTLRQSGDPQQQGLADVLAAITDLRRDMAQSRQIENLLNTIQNQIAAKYYGFLVPGPTNPADAEYLAHVRKNPYASLRPSYSHIPEDSESTQPTDVTPGTPIKGTRSESA